MCSRAARRLAAPLFGIALALPLALGCGHKDDPKPPPQKIPQQIQDLRISQRGNQLLISFTYPQVTISGLPIDDIVRIELWEYQMAVPDFTVDDDDEEGEEGAEESSDEGEEGSGEDPAEGEAEPAEDGEEPAAADGGPTAEEREPPAAGEEPAADGEAPPADDQERDAADEEPAAEDEEPVPGDDAEAEIATRSAEAPGDEEAPDEVDDEGEPPAPGDEETAADSAPEEPAEGEAAAEEEDDEGDDDDDRMVFGSKETLLELDPREFVAASQLRLVLEGEELSNAISGANVEVRLTLDEVEPGEKTALVFGVKSFQSLKRSSAFSNLFKIIPRVTPDPPAEIELEPMPSGVKLSWEFEGDEPLEYRFYRRDSLAPRFVEHFGTQMGDSDRFLDATAETGSSYAYTMTVIVNRSPLVESVFAPVSEIEYVDVFAPEAPTDLVVLSEVGTARLLWEGSSDADLAGYVVYRRTGSGDFERLNQEPVRQNEYSDTTAQSGRSYAYRIVAVDLEGNMSDPSEEVETRIP